MKFVRRQHWGREARGLGRTRPGQLAFGDVLCDERHTGRETSVEM